MDIWTVFMIDNFRDSFQPLPDSISFICLAVHHKSFANRSLFLINLILLVRQREPTEFQGKMRGRFKHIIVHCKRLASWIIGGEKVSTITMESDTCKNGIHTEPLIKL
jgi:hypothetical protein